VVVAYITGHGLKTDEAVAEPSASGRRFEIDPTLKSFRESVNI